MLEIATSGIEETPEFGDGVNTDLIRAMSKTRDRVILLLDINKVVTTEESSLAKNVSGNQGNHFCP